jgi:hypothetical protein
VERFGPFFESAFIGITQYALPPRAVWMQTVAMYAIGLIPIYTHFFHLITIFLALEGRKLERL